MCTTPMCCKDPCANERLLPYGYGPDYEPMLNFPTGGSPGTIQTANWRVQVSIGGNGEHSPVKCVIPDGSTPPTLPLRDTVVATYRRPYGISNDGIDGGDGTISEDAEFWPNDINKSLALSPTIQGINFVQMNLSLSFENGIGFYDNVNYIYSADTFVILPGVQITSNQSGQWLAWFRYDDAPNDEIVTLDPGPVQITFRLDPFSTNVDGQLNITVTVGSETRSWNDSSRLFHDSVTFGVQKTSGLSGDLVAEITSFSYTIAGGNETLIHDNIEFTAQSSEWTGGSVPTWTKGLESVAVGTCSGVFSFPQARKEVIAKDISVTPNQLYRIQLVMDPPQLNGSALVGPSFPTLIVDDKPARQLTEGTGGFPLFQPVQLGYYYRPYYPLMELALVANPNTSGRVLAVNVWEVSETFAIQYPFFINSDSIGKNFFNWIIDSNIVIAPTITGGTPPFLFELVNPGENQFRTGLPGDLSASTGEITNTAGAAEPHKGMIRCTDSTGIVAFSYRFKWQ